MIELELYTILEDNINNIGYYNNLFLPTPDEDTIINAVISYYPFDREIGVIENEKIVLKKYNIERKGENVFPTDFLDNYHKKIPYNNNVLFDIGRSYDINKYKNRDEDNKKNIVKLSIFYEQGKLNFNPKTHRINLIEMSYINKLHPFKKFFLKIINIDDYSEFNHFKYYTLIL